jgi:hypothetical protein
LPQKSARSCVVIVGTPFQTWAGKKLQQQQFVLVKRLLWNEFWFLRWIMRCRCCGIKERKRR